MIRVNNKVSLYARFSSDNQRSESIDAQIRAMKAYCKQHNFVIVNTYIDEAKSATTDRRPAFQQMIADSSNKTFDIVLVHKLDHLYILGHCIIIAEGNRLFDFSGLKWVHP